jgi:hypothetical protein
MPARPSIVGAKRSAGGALSGTAALAATYNDQANALLSQNFSLYGQDTWKVTPRLTVTYGLRWDVNPPLKGKSPANDPFTLTGLNNPATIALAPRGTRLYDTTYGNVAPRSGLAWQLGSAVLAAPRKENDTLSKQNGIGCVEAASALRHERIQKCARGAIEPQHAAVPAAVHIEVSVSAEFQIGRIPD